MNPNSDQGIPLAGSNLPGLPPQAASQQPPGAEAASAPVQVPVAPQSADPVALQQIVSQARQIMEQPAANPYQQSQALQQLKARYVGARYGINLKVT